MARYAVSAAAGYYVVTDSEQPAHAPTIAKCDRLDDARRIASSLNQLAGAVETLKRIGGLWRDSVTGEEQEPSGRLAVRLANDYLHTIGGRYE